MLRYFLTAGLVASSFQNVLAQHAQTTDPARLASIRSSEADFSASIASENSARFKAYDSKISSLSSRIGPFYSSAVFAPAVADGDYLSVVGSGGPDDPNSETTTYRAYQSFIIEKEDYWLNVQATTTLYAYQNFTVGPTTYMASETYAQWTAPLDNPIPGDVNSTILPGGDLTTICSLTTIAPKISIPDSVWRTQDFDTLLPDNWPTYSAVCTQEGEYTRSDSYYRNISSAFSTVETYSAEPWRWVTILGEDPYTMTKTGTAGGAQQTGGAAQAGSGSGTEGAKATSTQAAGASEVTAWVNAVVVVAAAAMMAV